jgi:hemerythrin-like domain-containing protein
VHGVNDPIGQLERSHRRLEEACAALSRAAKEHDIETVSDVCGFFARQGKRHEQDEDASLFPRLSALPAAVADSELSRVLSKLSAEHREHEALQERLERLVSGRDEDGEGGDLWSKLEATATALTRAYEKHIAEEEAAVFPEARRLLSSSALDDIVAEMNARRGRQ